MKTVFTFVIFMIFCHLFSCQQTTSETKEKDIAETVEEAPLSADTVIEKPKPISKPIRHYRYVSAKEGISYYAAPKGVKKGRFSLNTEVIVINYTGVFETSSNKNDSLKTEWLGIDYQQDTVYIKNDSISENYTLSDLNIYYVGSGSPYYSMQTGAPSFINLSENNIFSILSENDLGPDSIEVDAIGKKELLNKMELFTTDTVFIYSFNENTVYKFVLSDLPVIAYINTYAEGNSQLYTMDYEIGFNLQHRYQTSGESFVFVGSSNPFQTNKLIKMIWEEIDPKELPSHLDTTLNNYFTKFAPNLGKAYTFSAENFRYFVQDFRNQYSLYQRYLFVIDTTSQEVVYHHLYSEGESANLNTLNTGNQEHYYKQWTGQAFKQKPWILYGFVSESFGCPAIRFFGDTEPPIEIRCDNRH